MSGSEADWLRFFAATEHVWATGTRNPVGLFGTLVCGGHRSRLALCDEDKVRRRPQDSKADRNDGHGSGPHPQLQRDNPVFLIPVRTLGIMKRGGILRARHWSG